MLRVLSVAASLTRITIHHLAAIDESGRLANLDTRVRHVAATSMLTSRWRSWSISDALGCRHLLGLVRLRVTLLMIDDAFLAVGLPIELRKSHELIIVRCRHFRNLITRLSQLISHLAIRAWLPKSWRDRSGRLLHSRSSGRLTNVSH